MWFKQATIWQLIEPVAYEPEAVEEQIARFAFSPCLPSLPSGHGWVSPIDKEGAPLVHAANGYLLLCMQIQEKILPATVVRQELDLKIKHIRETEHRKVSSKEKMTIKDELTFTLLPKAFSKLTRIYAYIDTKHNWLVVDSSSASKVDMLLELLSKSMEDMVFSPIKIKKIPTLLTHWLLSNDHPNQFFIEDACVLKDPNQQSRVIRCQHQDLEASAIQSLLKDGCEVAQLALNWQDRIRFNLSEEFQIKSIKYSDEVLSLAKDYNSDTPELQFDSDFFIMTETLTHFIQDLLKVFQAEPDNITTSEPEEAVV